MAAIYKALHTIAERQGIDVDETPIVNSVDVDLRNGHRRKAVVFDSKLIALARRAAGIGARRELQAQLKSAQEQLQAADAGESASRKELQQKSEQTPAEAIEALPAVLPLPKLLVTRELRATGDGWAK